MREPAKSRYFQFCGRYMAAPSFVKTKVRSFFHLKCKNVIEKFLIPRHRRAKIHNIVVKSQVVRESQNIWRRFLVRTICRIRSARNALKTPGIDSWNNFNEKLYSSFFLNFDFFIAKIHFEEPGRKNLITFQISFRGNDFSFVNRLQRKNRFP